ncbi:MAG: type I-C CRISPR-associated protein Cas8c/Csd1, partial [Anaerovoracaceae bacterium]
NHPNKIRNTGDKAKLISANDSSGFTYRGRFLNYDEAALVSYEVSQKAHNALKYLIKKQGGKSNRSRYGDKVFVLWDSQGYYIPGLCEDSLEALSEIKDKVEYTGEEAARAFNKALVGYGKKFSYESQTLAILGLDAATTGRMSITFYREFLGNELIENINKWHESCSWKHRYKFSDDKKVIEFVGAPSPKDIVLTAFGVERTFLEADGKLLAMVGERIIRCIADGTPIPRDIVDAAFRNACHPQNYSNLNNWKKVLSISCSLIKKYRYDSSNEKEVWTVEVQKECKDVAYLCGRLLGVADLAEREVLKSKNETRETAAMRYFTKFQERPCNTWAVISGSIRPYMNALEPKKRIRYEIALQEISAMINPEAFKEAKNLDGKMALGFYSQQHEFFQSKKVTENIVDAQNEEVNHDSTTK